MKTQAELRSSGPDGSSKRGFAPKLSVAVLVLWTLFVWVGRLRNLAAADGGFATASRWSLVGSIVFVSLAVLVGFGLVLKNSSRVTAGIVAVLALVTIGVWIVRAIGIVLADHSWPFIAVHCLLAVVSIGLALWALQNSRKAIDQMGSFTT